MGMSAVTFLMGCESQAGRLPEPPYSTAIPQDNGSSLARAMESGVKAHKGLSGFHIITTGSEGFRMRLALMRAAEKTLDLQYYGIHDDATSNLMLEAIVRTAQRGVRIRFLLDNNTFHEVEKTLSLLDEFKNLEIRVFNPFYRPDHSLATKLVKTLTDLEKIERRMHNKVMISDNQMAILGGRNLGDEYFEENADMLFKDIDILAAGPVVAGISESFDQYWNDEKALPIQRLKRKRASVDEIVNARAQLHDHWEKVAKTEKGRTLLTAKTADILKTADFQLTWARAELAVDEPSKIDASSNTAHSEPFAALIEMVNRAEKEFVVISPYFVPRGKGVEWLAGLVERGVHVRILTNSLASTDVVAVHVGYRPYREALVRRGVELYEMKPIGGRRPRQRLLGKKVPAHASLHAKVYVVDRQDVMIGSFNLDPRSIEINTEITLAIHSPAIAMQVMKIFDEVIEPDTSYRLMMPPEAGLDGGGLVWKAQDAKGQDTLYRSEPKAGFWRKLQEKALSLLPLEDHL